MNLKEKYTHNIAALPRGLFSSEQDAWAVLQAIILRYNVVVEVDEEDIRVDLIYEWLRAILPACLQKEVLIIRPANFLDRRRALVAETYQAALRSALWGGKVSHVFLGRVSESYEFILSMNEAPTISVRLTSDDKDAELITFAAGKRFSRIEEADAAAWFKAAQDSTQDISAARSIIASMVEMNKRASDACYNHRQIPSSSWGHIFRWARSQAFAEGRDSLQVEDCLAIRYFMPDHWVDYAVNHWSPELSPDHYPVVEPLLRALRRAAPHS